MEKSTKVDTRSAETVAREGRRGPVHLEVAEPCSTCGTVANRTKCGEPILGSVMSPDAKTRTIGTALTDIPSEVTCGKCGVERQDERSS